MYTWGRAAAEGFSPKSPCAHWIGPEMRIVQIGEQNKNLCIVEGSPRCVYGVFACVCVFKGVETKGLDPGEICIYIYTYTHIHVHIYTYIHLTYIHLCIYIYVCIYIYMCRYVHKDGAERLVHLRDIYT